MTRTFKLGIAFTMIVALGAGGWAAAGSLLPAHAAAASSGRLLEVRYEVRRETAYAPPPPTETTRLDVLNPQSPTVVEDGVVSAQAGQALRSLGAEDDARAAAALAAVRAEDARIDRDTAAALEAGRLDASDVSPAAQTRSDS